MKGSPAVVHGGATAKQRLDAETIIAAGFEIAARPGAKTVSVRELGAFLEADPTAIYRHFRNKQELMRALLDRVLVMSLARVTAPREQWRARLTQLATASLDMFIAYPAIGIEAIMINTEGPGEFEVVEFILDALATVGLEGDDLVHTYAAWSAFVLACGSGIAQEKLASEGSEESQEWLGRSLPVAASTHPHISALREPLLALRGRDVFKAGIEALLDAAEATAARQRNASAD